MASSRTPLGRVRGLGSAKHGVGHFVAQRASACALVLLVAWGLYCGFHLAQSDYAGAAAWLHSPWNAVPLALLLGAAFFHMNIGARTIIEDYVHGAMAKASLLMLNLFVCWLGAAVGIFSILKVAFGGGAS